MCGFYYFVKAQSAYYEVFAYNTKRLLCFQYVTQGMQYALMLPYARFALTSYNKSGALAHLWLFCNVGPTKIMWLFLESLISLRLFITAGMGKSSIFQSKRFALWQQQIKRKMYALAAQSIVQNLRFESEQMEKWSIKFALCALAIENKGQNLHYALNWVKIKHALRTLHYRCKLQGLKQLCAMELLKIDQKQRNVLHFL